MTELKMVFIYTGEDKIPLNDFICICTTVNQAKVAIKHHLKAMGYEEACDWEGAEIVWGVPEVDNFHFEKIFTVSVLPKVEFRKCDD